MSQSLKFKFSREFAMANSQTFLIPQVSELISRYFDSADFWIDPFANENSPAHITNDLNSKFPTNYNLEFYKFFDVCIKKYGGQVYGVFLDPPYSPEQIKRSYEGIGKKWSQKEGKTQGGFYSASWKKIIQLKPMLVIQCGWQSNGNTTYYEMIEQLQLYHGSQHFDTLITVWKRKNHSLEDFL